MSVEGPLADVPLHVRARILGVMSNEIPADEAPAATDGGDKPATTGTLIVAIALYTAARLALVVVIAAIIFFVGKAAGVDVPLVVAAVFGVLIALPVGMVAFKTLRLRVNDQITRIDAARSARHDELQARLRGDSK
ncbi:hypothetical protein nbrc107696_01250 [Gordonia spumicola]|uniref:DUF4229 domain-containing protein n=2 Tax=Gordonia spumicola TaxID=589161 RepID=A0A7I9V2N2_9ACTN|nr:hypothetical protein nbrc107696_01250 [Gordonia spumicola]